MSSPYTLVPFSEARWLVHTAQAVKQQACSSSSLWPHLQNWNNLSASAVHIHVHSPLWMRFYVWLLQCPVWGAGQVRGHPQPAAVPGRQPAD